MHRVKNVQSEIINIANINSDSIYMYKQGSSKVVAKPLGDLQFLLALKFIWYQITLFIPV